MKQTEITDYTAMKANKKLRLVKCPECGRVGRLTKYTDGSAAIAHKGRIEFGMFNIIEHCLFKHWVKS